MKKIYKPLFESSQWVVTLNQHNDPELTRLGKQPTRPKIEYNSHMKKLYAIKDLNPSGPSVSNNTADISPKGLMTLARKTISGGLPDPKSVEEFFSHIKDQMKEGSEFFTSVVKKGAFQNIKYEIEHYGDKDAKTHKVTYETFSGKALNLPNLKQPLRGTPQKSAQDAEKEIKHLIGEYLKRHETGKILDRMKW